MSQATETKNRASRLAGNEVMRTVIIAAQLEVATSYVYAAILHPSLSTGFFAPSSMRKTRDDVEDWCACEKDFYPERHTMRVVKVAVIEVPEVNDAEG